MTAKQYFHRVAAAERELRMLNAKIEHFRDLGISLGSGIIGGGVRNPDRSRSRVEIAACGATDASMSINEQQRELMAIIAQAEALIRKVPQQRYRDILTYRYICGKSLRWISDELDYTDPNSIYRAHGWALKEAQKVLDKIRA